MEEFEAEVVGLAVLLDGLFDLVLHMKVYNNCRRLS